jgi:hypothetical protein
MTPPKGLWEAHRGGLVEGRNNTRHRKHCFDDGFHAGAAHAYEQAARIAETEPEFPNSPPPEVIDHALTYPVDALRSAVKVTKKSIAKNIRARAEKEKE